MLVEKVEKYYDKSYKLNCAETIIYAANEEYNLKLTPETLKTMAAFGGGMGVEGVCGALTGALAVLGILYTKERAHESDRVKTLAAKLYRGFEEKLGSDNCKALKEKYKNDDKRCMDMVVTAAEVLQSIVEEEER